MFQLLQMFNMRIAAVSNKIHPINRIYFFTGLVLLTGFLILISMLDINKEAELFIYSWAIVGLQIGMLSILLALSNLCGLLKKVVSEKLKIWKLIISGITVGMLFIIISSLVIEFLYNSNILEPLVYKNTFMVITLFGPVFLLWPFMKEKR